MLKPLLQRVAWLADSLWPLHREAPASFSLISTKSLAPRQGQLPGEGRCVSVSVCVYGIWVCVCVSELLEPEHGVSCLSSKHRCPVDYITLTAPWSPSHFLFLTTAPLVPSAPFWTLISDSHPPRNNFFTHILWHRQGVLIYDCHCCFPITSPCLMTSSPITPHFIFIRLWVKVAHASLECEFLTGTGSRWKSSILI